MSTMPQRQKKKKQQQKIKAAKNEIILFAKGVIFLGSPLALWPMLANSTEW